MLKHHNRSTYCVSTEKLTSMDSPLKMSLTPNKHLKEQFVSYLTGSSMFELFLLITTLCFLILLRRTISSLTATGPHSEASLKKDDDASVRRINLRTHVTTATADFLWIFIPAILILTVLADWIYVNAVLLVLLLLLSIVAIRFRSSFQVDGAHSLRTYISSYRVCMMMLTCVCILAVDFKIFPRRYAKTETYGTSLMDFGVGAFVLGNSLVSRQARGISSVNLKSVLRSTFPLTFLGFARLIFTRGVNYQVHVGEYGVHWNFFFTLAAVAICTSVINVPPSYCGILGSLILIGYQGLLSLGLNEYLLSEKRGTDIISQNKEGIFSIFGYWGMYLIGVQLGSYLFFRNHPDGVSTNKRARNRVWILCLLFWLLTYCIDRHVERVSRRMCNLAYVMMVLALNIQVLAIFMLSEFIPGDKISTLEKAFDRNLLGSFLLANVLTGLVNLSIDTLSVSSVSAVSILVIYSFVLSISAVVADFYGIKLKFG